LHGTTSQRSTYLDGSEFNYRVRSKLPLGHGWLIFRLPPAEAGIHPAEPSASAGPHQAGRQLLGSVLYLLCDDLRATIESFEAKNVRCSEVEEESWGLRTSIVLPSGSQIGLYQPKHALAITA
jgi:hypothetical protein